MGLGGRTGPIRRARRMPAVSGPWTSVLAKRSKENPKSLAAASTLAMVSCVPCRYADFEHLFVVHWGVPNSDDCKRVEAQIRRQRQRASRQLVYLAVMPADLPSLDENGRKLLMELTEAVLPDCERLVIIIEAGGFRGALLRSAMTAVTLVTRRADALKVVANVDAAYELVAASLPGDRRGVSRALASAGATLPASLSAA